MLNYKECIFNILAMIFIKIHNPLIQYEIFSIISSHLGYRREQESVQNYPANSGRPKRVTRSKPSYPIEREIVEMLMLK